MTAAVPNAALVPPGPAAAPAATQRQAATTGQPAEGPSFADVLAQRTAAAQSPSPATAPSGPGTTTAAQAPTFSRHALERVSRRGIQLDQSTLQRLAGGMSRAAQKGSRDAVVFVDNTAFVVSVPNKTVITAVTPEHMRQQVFTNIDSAVIA